MIRMSFTAINHSLNPLHWLGLKQAVLATSPAIGEDKAKASNLYRIGISGFPAILLSAILVMHKEWCKGGGS